MSNEVTSLIPDKIDMAMNKSHNNERHTVPLFASNLSVADSHTSKTSLNLNINVYINSSMNFTKRTLAKVKKKTAIIQSNIVLEENLNKELKKYQDNQRYNRYQIISWMKERIPEARYFLTLTFSYEPTYDQAHKAAQIFQHEVSTAIAGKRATRHGRYAHPMAITMEQQKSGRWHLHVMMEALPAEYERIVYVDHLKARCAEIWQTLRYKKKPTEKFSLIEQRKNSVDDFSAKIAGEHSAKWFQELMTYEDMDRCFSYITKTYFKQGSDFLAATY